MNKKEYMKKYYQEHKEELKKTSNEYYINHRGEHSVWAKEWYRKNKNKSLQTKKDWFEKNKEKIYKLRNQRRKIDIKYKLSCYLRNRLNKVLRGFSKSVSVLKLIDCSIEQLKQHLESKFTYGMSWKNYGKWHVDHIRPCASYDLSKVSEQHKCFHYTNLQPLWAKDNLSKNDKFQK